MQTINRFIFLALSLVIITGCGNKKTTETVFDSSTQAFCEANTIANRYVVHWEDGSFSVEETAEGTTDDEFRKTFVEENLQAIKKVDRDYRIQIKNSELQIANSTGLSWGPEKIQAPQVWAQGFTGQNIKVGVVDGMVDATHSQLVHAVISAEQFNSEINNPAVNTHGTHVTGIIAANPNAGPVAGVAPQAQILSGQFIGNTGGGSLGDAILAMNSVANKGARIINMSWGGAGCVTSLRDAVENLSRRGILIVTAAGNEGVNSDFNPDYPAAFRLENQINVAASTIDDRFISFSNRGYRTVNIVAPGVSIYSTIPGNRIEMMDGTSMAAPMVSGAAALLWSAIPEATVQQIKQALYLSVDTNSDYQVSTRGRLNVKKALDTLRSMFVSEKDIALDQ